MVFVWRRCRIGSFRGLSGHRDPLWSEQPQRRVRPNRERMNVEASRLLIGHFHDRGGR